MLDTVNSLIDTLIQILKKFSWFKFISIIVVIVLSVVALAIFERYTSYFRLQKLEKAAEILNTLQASKADGKLGQNPELEKIHTQLVSELEREIHQREMKFNPTISPEMWKFIYGGALWWILSFASLIDVFRGRDQQSELVLFFVIMIIGIIFGGLGILIPDIPWLNFIVYPISNFVLLWTIMILLVIRYENSGKNQTVAKV